MMRKRILSVFGTRPEAIKMAPLVLELNRRPGIENAVCVTGQHRDLLDPVLDLFGIDPRYDLDVMKPDQDVAGLTADILLAVGDVLRDNRPDLVLVQGDTTTCFAAALAGFYASVPVGHVEAGLRTGDLAAPFPEEANRRLVSRVATYHFAPTEQARDVLLSEGVSPDTVWVTGNTVVDAVLFARDKTRHLPVAGLRAALGSGVYERLSSATRQTILITWHRRENLGRRLADLCAAVRCLARQHPDWYFVFPVHPNPSVRKTVYAELSGLNNVELIEPLSYLPFVWLMSAVDLIITDSGGIQEEAPSLGTPVIVTRDVTERQEAVAAGAVTLVGTDPAALTESAQFHMANPRTIRRRLTVENPYGDGKAAQHIAGILCSLMNDDTEQRPLRALDQTG